MTGPEPTVLPYGSWPTPVTSELVVRSARLPSAVRSDGDDVWWSESPPGGGRAHRDPPPRRRRRAGPRCCPPRGTPASGVHEYGGGAWWVRGGVLWFVDWATQRIHRLSFDGDPDALDPQPITPEPDRAPGAALRRRRRAPGRHHAALRAGGAPRRRRGREHDRPARRRRTVRAGGRRVGARLRVEPRWRPDGDAFCWLEWDHPDMPWDAARLVVDEGGERTVVAGGRAPGVDRASPPGRRTARSGSPRTAPGSGACTGGRPPAGSSSSSTWSEDIGLPHWVFGQSVLRAPARAVGWCSSTGSTASTTCRSSSPMARVTPVELGATSLEGVRPHGEGVVLVAASPVSEPHVVGHRPGPGSRRRARPTPRPRPRRRRGGRCPRRSTSRPPAASTPTPCCTRRPTPTSSVRRASAPPLLVIIHGGPTSAARPMLRLSTQYWTSRGFAVVDVNYRGSTGYGRAYRDLLQGQWGIADVEDCVAVARPPRRRRAHRPRPLLHPGGSAGGFTTLAALAFHDVFAAGAVPLRRGRPRPAGPGHPQVRGPLPRRAGRPVARGPRGLRRPLADPPPRGHHRAARGVPGPRRRGGPAQPGRDDRRGPARPRRAGGVRGVRGRGPRLPPGRQHPRLARRRAVLLRPGPRLRPPRRTRASTRSSSAGSVR